MKIKIQQHKLIYLKKIDFDGMFVVNPIGRSSGVVLLWKDDMEVEIQNYSDKHINIVVIKNLTLPRYTWGC